METTRLLAELREWVDNKLPRELATPRSSVDRAEAIAQVNQLLSMLENLLREEQLTQAQAAELAALREKKGEATQKWRPESL